MTTITPELANVKALTFDTFGTVVDWRGSIAREVRAMASEKKLRVNAAKFADAWRSGYRPAMNRVASGELPWTKIDVLHRIILDDVLAKFRSHGDLVGLLALLSAGFMGTVQSKPNATERKRENYSVDGQRGHVMSARRP
jgi:FMN phosphatase YigB (HAD superfamily)